MLGREAHATQGKCQKGKEKRKRVKFLWFCCAPLPFKPIIRDLHAPARAHTHTHTHTHRLSSYIAVVCVQTDALGSHLMRLQQVRICALLAASQSAWKGAGLMSSISFAKESQTDLKPYKLESAHHDT